MIRIRSPDSSFSVRNDEPSENKAYAEESISSLAIVYACADAYRYAVEHGAPGVEFNRFGRQMGFACLRGATVVDSTTCQLPLTL
jgi:hypothetical protein